MVSIRYLAWHPKLFALDAAGADNDAARRKSQRSLKVLMRDAAKIHNGW